MKRIVLAAAFVLGSFTMCLAQETVVSSVKEVTVYTSGAMVKREGSAKVGKGVRTLAMDVRAFDIDRYSLSARVFGEGEVQGVQYRETPVSEAPQEAVKQAEQKLKKLKEIKRQIEDEKAVLDKKELFLTSLMKAPEQPGTPERRVVLPTVQDLDRMLAFLGRSLTDINEKRQPLDMRIEEMNRQIAAAERELSALKGSSEKTRRVIEVTFDSAKEQTVKVEASYLVSRASWQPLYKVSVPADQQQADLAMFATISQKTGEDWKDAALTVSNVVPLRGSALPDLRSWFLDVPRAHYEAMRAAAPAAKAKQEANADREGMPEADFASAERTETGISMEYRLAGKVSVESGARETVAPLFSRRLAGDFSYYAVPRSNPLTFLVCGAKADKELLAGPVNSYFAGRFVGKTTIGEKRAGESFQLNLGADRQIKVGRETVRDTVKETSWGFERKNVVRELAYRITVENLRDKPVKIKVIDPVPVSKTDRIEVKDLKLSPEPSDRAYEKREGVCAWDLEVRPGTKQEIAVQFTVTYPKDSTPVGL